MPRLKDVRLPSRILSNLWSAVLLCLCLSGSYFGNVMTSPPGPKTRKDPPPLASVSHTTSLRLAPKRNWAKTELVGVETAQQLGNCSLSLPPYCPHHAHASLISLKTLG